MSAVNLGSVGRRGDPARASRTLHIDWTRCDGRGLCTELLAEVLVRDEWGYPWRRDRRPGRARTC
nr:hypothetical protein GCM10025699_76920 [Microbacterium flavescens]